MHIFRHIAPKFLDIRQYACEISAQSDKKSDCAICARADTKQALTNIPDGFEIVFQNDNIEETHVFITEYQKVQKYIIFSQYIKSRYDINVNTEGYEMERIDINGNEGFIVDMVDDYYIALDI